MKKYKQFIIGFIIGSLIFSFVAVSASESLRVLLNRFPIFVNGEQQNIEAYNINDYTYLKLADVGKVLGAKVVFNQTNDRIEITSATQEYSNTANNNSTVTEEVYNDMQTQTPSIENQNIDNTANNNQTEKTWVYDNIKIIETSEGKYIEKDGEKYITYATVINKIREIHPDNFYDIVYNPNTMEVILKNQQSNGEVKRTNTGVFVIKVDKPYGYTYCLKYDDFKNKIIPMITK